MSNWGKTVDADLILVICYLLFFTPLLVRSGMWTASYLRRMWMGIEKDNTLASQLVANSIAD